MIEVYFDEAGYTGNRLLDKEQPYYCYAGVRTDERPITQEDISCILLASKCQMPELKGARLVRSSSGRDVLRTLWKEYGSNCRLIIHDKKYALACKMFEYIFEPILAAKSSLLYRNRFHRYIAAVLFDSFEKGHASSVDLFAAFERFARNPNDNKLERYVSTKIATDTEVISLIFKFARNNIEIFRNELESGSTDHGWLLDLTETSLYCLLVDYAGNGNTPIKAYCDRSDPLMVHSKILNAFIGDERILYQKLGGLENRLNFNLAAPICLVDSKAFAPIQVADAFASSVAFALRSLDDEFSKEIFELSRASLVWSGSVWPVATIAEFPRYMRNFYKKLLIKRAEPLKVEALLEIVESQSIELAASMIRRTIKGKH